MCKGINLIFTLQKDISVQDVGNIELKLKMNFVQDAKVKNQKRVAVAMFSEPVTLRFIFETIGVIFVAIAIGIFLVKNRSMN
jgi:hypothetical protein